MTVLEIIADVLLVFAAALIIAGCATVSLTLALFAGGVLLLIAGLVLTGLAMKRPKPPPGVVDHGPFEPGS